MGYEEDNDEVTVSRYVVTVALSALAVALIAGVSVRACGLWQDKNLGVAEENVRRENFEQTKSYRDGLRRDFDELLRDYAKASDEERPAIVSVMRHRAEGVPPELVPAEVRRLVQ